MKDKQYIKKPPGILIWLLSKMKKYDETYSSMGDFFEYYDFVYKNESRLKATLFIWLNVLKSYYGYFKLKIGWSSAMFKNYLKVALRNFSRNRLFSFINVFGLAIGIASCMVITLWVQRELSYDRFHRNADKIFRIERQLFRDNSYSNWPVTGGAYKQSLIDEYPEIKNAMRFWDLEYPVKDYKNVMYNQFLFAVDNSIFEIFDFELKEGDPKTALKEPNTVVLTGKSAIRYFGTEDAVGKSLTMEIRGEMVSFRVTGILKDIPVNSHVHFDVLISISTFSEDRFADWRSNYLYTYVLISDKSLKNSLEEKLKVFVEKYLKANYGDLLVGEANIHDVLKMKLFPLTDIHLHPKANHEIEPQGNVYSVYIFSCISILILVIACINFINLSTARANKRAVEVGLRKTVGANKAQLRGQFIGETVIFAVIASILSLAVTAFFIQIYNFVFNDTLSFSLLFRVKNLIILFGVTAAVGLFSGLYPAFYLARFEPAKVLKRELLSGKRKFSLRRNMVIIQFVISITIIIGVLTIHRQMKYIQTRDLGFDKESVVLLSAGGMDVVQGFEAFRNELVRSTNIKSVSASNDVPGDKIFSNTNIIDPLDESKTHHSMYYLIGDYDFNDTYKIPLIAGRGFSRDFLADSASVILNEAAVKKLGWTPEESIGKQIYTFFSNLRVIGVVKNFNFKSLKREIEPLFLLLSTRYINYISVRIQPGPVMGTIDFIRQKWEKIFPGEQFEYKFLDDYIEEFYENEKKLQSISLIFSCLSIFVACLGLFGLAAYTAELKTKEVGIRKVLGASVPDIMKLMYKEFIALLIISYIISLPIAYYLMNRWLQDFTYRKNLSIDLFIISGIIAIFIALITISYSAVKTASSNPVDSLKYE